MAHKKKAEETIYRRWTEVLLPAIKTAVALFNQTKANHFPSSNIFSSVLVDFLFCFCVSFFFFPFFSLFLSLSLQNPTHAIRKLFIFFSCLNYVLSDQSRPETNLNLIWISNHKVDNEQPQVTRSLKVKNLPIFKIFYHGLISMLPEYYWLIIILNGPASEAALGPID